MGSKGTRTLKPAKTSHAAVFDASVVSRIKVVADEFECWKDSVAFCMLKDEFE